MSVIICPDGNLNGGNPHEKVDLTAEACDALHLAMRKAEAVFPHPRDYQNSPAGTYEAHAAEARRRLEMLQEVYSLYGADVLAVDAVVARSTVHRRRTP